MPKRQRASETAADGGGGAGAGGGADPASLVTTIVPAPRWQRRTAAEAAGVAAAAAAAAEAAAAPESVMIQLRTMSGENQGPPLDVPANVTPKQLELLVQKLLGEDAPYTFFLNREELLDSLWSALCAQKLSTEAVHAVHFQQLATFRVLPVTRCSDSLPGHTDAILHVSFSPDGRLVASGGGDATVRFWDARSNTPKFVCAGHKHHVLATAWSPDGRLFASGDKVGEVRVWDPSTGKEACRPLRQHTAWVTALAWEPLHSGAVGAASELIASASKDKSVRVWNARTGACAFTLSGHTDSVECLRWGGGGLMYTGSRDRSIIVWAVDEAKGHAKVVRTLTGHAHRVNALALNTDHACRTGPFAHDKTSFETPAIAHAAATAKYAAALASVGGEEVLVSCSDDLTLMLWHPARDRKHVARLSGHQAPVNHLSFSPDGRYVASGSFDKKVKLWCGSTGKFLANFVGHVGAVYQVCWSPESRYIASASKDSTVKIWPAAAIGGGGAKAVKPVALHTLSGHADEVYALDWAPAGETLASGSKDRLLKIWRH